MPKNAYLKQQKKANKLKINWILWINQGRKELKEGKILSE